MPDQRAGWRLVRDDQTSGRTKTCVNCDVAVGGEHHILCHAAAKERMASRPAMCLVEHASGWVCTRPAGHGGKCE